MEKRYLDEYSKNGLVETEEQEKLNIPVVRQRFIERKERLLRDLEYYNIGINGGGQFAPCVHTYIKTIYGRIVELDYILENVV